MALFILSSCCPVAICAACLSWYNTRTSLWKYIGAMRWCTWALDMSGHFMNMACVDVLTASCTVCQSRCLLRPQRDHACSCWTLRAALAAGLCVSEEIYAID